MYTHQLLQSSYSQIIIEKLLSLFREWVWHQMRVTSSISLQQATVRGQWLWLLPSFCCFWFGHRQLVLHSWVPYVKNGASCSSIITTCCAPQLTFLSAPLPAAVICGVVWGCCVATASVERLAPAWQVVTQGLSAGWAWSTGTPRTSRATRTSRDCRSEWIQWPSGEFIRN